MRASSIALAMGTLRLIAAASAPSARSHDAAGSAPASSSRRRSATPVHSLQEINPWSSPARNAGGVAPYMSWLFPEHSMKWIRDRIGYRMSASMVKIRGRLTMPWTRRRCCSGSMSGTPLWCRSKCSPLGVIVPSSISNGVREAPLPVVPGWERISVRMTLLSYFAGPPYVVNGAPGYCIHGGVSGGPAAPAVPGAPAARPPRRKIRRSSSPFVAAGSTADGAGEDRFGRAISPPVHCFPRSAHLRAPHPAAPRLGSDERWRQSRRGPEGCQAYGSRPAPPSFLHPCEPQMSRDVRQERRFSIDSASLSHLTSVPFLLLRPSRSHGGGRPVMTCTREVRFRQPRPAAHLA